MQRLRAGLCGLLLFAYQPAAQARDSVTIDIWHGLRQRIGHLGRAQDDFNVLGHASPHSSIRELTCRVNGGAPKALTFVRYRRLVDDGDFNADIPLDLLTPGENTIRISARTADSIETFRELIVEKFDSGSAPLPMRIAWRDIDNPQDVGQYVDGKWEHTSAGLRNIQTGYDRLFLIGNKTWRDFEIVVPVTINRVKGDGPGVGVVMRFAGHVVGGPLQAPDVQPKWGYLPFGAIGWLRWRNGTDTDTARVQFYSGQSERKTNFGAYPVREGETHIMRLRCETLPDDGDYGVTVYSFKIWHSDSTEPSAWAWRAPQRSKTALRSGGAALVAHYVDATFGDLKIKPVVPMSVAMTPAGGNSATQNRSIHIYIHDRQPRHASPFYTALGRRNAWHAHSRAAQIYFVNRKAEQ